MICKTPPLKPAVGNVSVNPGLVLSKFLTSPQKKGTAMSDYFLRLPQIIGNRKAKPPIQGIILVSKTTWWAGIKSGIYPPPVKLSPRVCVWRASEIQALINQPQK